MSVVKNVKNRRIWMTCLLLALAMVLNAGAACAEGDAKGQNIVDPVNQFDHCSAVLYDNTNGLPTSEANAIAETSDGFIWIGSYAGLIRYDGNTFVRMDSTTGLTSVVSLYVDSQDRLWVGTNDNGVAVMENGEFRRWGKLEGMKSTHTRAITEDQNGNIYVATTSGIMMIDSQFNLTAMEEEEIADAYMRSLLTGPDGILYGTTDSGDLLTIQDGKLTSFIHAEDSSTQGAGYLLPDAEAPGKVYVECSEFVLLHATMGETLTDVEKINIDPLRYIQSMQYIDGKLWICAGNGIGVLDGERFTVLQGLPMDNSVGNVMTDYLGNLWFTSSRQGVMKVVSNQFLNVCERYGLPQMVVNSTCMYEGNLFVGTDTGLLVLGGDGPLSRLPLTKAVTASGTALEADDLLALLDGSRIRSIIRDSRNQLWISTWRTCGLLRYAAGELTVFTEEDGLLSNSIRAVSECEDGRILVALTGGVNVIEDNQVVAACGEADGIDDTESLTVTEGLNREIVLGSNGGGIYILDKSGTRNINVEDGLPSDIVMRVKRDPKRDLIWIVTSSAIAYMTPDYQVTTIKKFPYSNNFDLCFLIADVSGKGTSAALFMMTAKTMIKDYTLNLNSTSEIFTAVNARLCESNEVGMFATAWIGIIDKRTMTLQYTNAGHNYPLLKRKGQPCEIVKKTHGLFLAGMEFTRYRQEEIQLEPGDRLLLYTDGVVEAHNRNNELYGDDRLKNKLDSVRDLSGEQVLESIFDLNYSPKPANCRKAPHSSGVCAKI